MRFKSLVTILEYMAGAMDVAALEMLARCGVLASHFNDRLLEHISLEIEGIQ